MSIQKDGMTNHQKTSLVEDIGLDREFSFTENILLTMGLGWVVSYMERVRVLRTIKNRPGMTVTPANDVSYNDFPLSGDGIDYD